MVFNVKNLVNTMGIRPGHNGDQILKNGTISNGSATIYTVPANKVFLLCNSLLRVEASVAGVYGRLYIYDNAGVIQYYLGLGGVTGTLTDHFIQSFNPPMECGAGWYIALYTSGLTCTAYGCLFGILVDDNSGII